MRTREPSRTMDAAGAGAWVVALAGDSEEGDGRWSKPDAAAAAATDAAGGESARGAASRLVPSIAAGVETKGLKCAIGDAGDGVARCGCD